MSPANIEAKLKASSPVIGQAIAIGDGKPYNVALITLDPDVAPAFEAQQAARRPAWREVRARCGAANEQLARVEQIKRYRLLDDGLAAGRRRADAHDEAEAQADPPEVRGGDRGAVRLTLSARGARRPRCPPR